jgi:hypothetical protein
VVPSSDTAYRKFLVASLLMATLVGFVLAIHVPIERLLDVGRAERTADLVQAHGQVQLLGFAGLYVMGMSLRLLPRFAGARLALEWMAEAALWCMVAALLLRAVVMPWFSGDVHDALLVASWFGVLLAASGYLMTVLGTLANDPRRADASSLAFALGSMTLFATSSIGVATAMDVAGSGGRTLPYLADDAIVQLQMWGFLLVVISGVALRALPVMVGLERPLQGSKVAPAGLSGAVVVLGASLLYLQYGSYGETVVRLADAAFVALGLLLLGLAWQAGVLRPAANRIRPSSQPHLWLIRGAFVWLVAAAVLAVYTGAAAFVDGALPSQFDFDGVRHALGVGVITSLILGMSLMILPEFAVERQGPNRQRQLALALAVLINASVVLRVAPAVAGSAWSFDDRNLAMAVAGSLAELAMLGFAVYYLRLVWRGRRS